MWNQRLLPVDKISSQNQNLNTPRERNRHLHHFTAKRKETKIKFKMTDFDRLNVLFTRNKYYSINKQKLNNNKK